MHKLVDGKNPYRALLQRAYSSAFQTNVGRVVIFSVNALSIGTIYLFIESVWSNTPKLTVLLASVSIYLLYLGITVVAFILFVTIRILGNPRQHLRDTLGSREIVNDLLANLYGVELVNKSEQTEIHDDGSFETTTEVTLRATTNNFRSYEIFAVAITANNARSYVDRESISVLPAKYGPVQMRERSYRRGYYIVQFAKELEHGEQAILSYKLRGEGSILALTPAQYLQGIPFEYSSHMIKYPCRKLRVRLSFSPGYPVDVTSSRPRPVVWYGNSHVEHVGETTRASDSFNFAGREASLELLDPVLALQYAVVWTVSSDHEKA